MPSTNDRTDHAEPRPDSPPPRFEWDWWHGDALERGLDEDLADLGRAVLREAVQHGWNPRLRALCLGDVLGEVLLRAPGLARRLCELLLETDGLRVARAEDGDKTASEMIELGGFGF